MNRRTFLSTSIATTFAAALSRERSWASPRPSDAARAPHRIDRVGLQLYTVRNLMKKDFEGTLAKVAQVGYKEVEFAGYEGHSAKDVRAMLDRDGLSAVSQHVDAKVLENSFPEALETGHILGQTFIVCPWIDVSQRKSPDGWKRAAETFNKAGEASQKAGIQFAYHNHAFEFEPSEALGGKMPYDFLLAETDPNLVKMEMDLCWITVGGQDPLKYFDKYPGRFPLVHVKDWTTKGPSGDDYGGAKTAKSKPGHMTNVGQGDIDWKRIFAQSEKAGIQHYFVENDEAKSVDDAKVSYDYLAKLEF
jgi:sugar phosphate isomerase/epimerase